MGITAAITGINSYIALPLLKKLEKDKSVEKIIGIDVTPWKGGFKKVEFYKEDIRSGLMGDILSGVDTVYHFAFIVSEIKDKSKTFDINIEGSKNIFRACVKNNVKKVIYTSSNTVYGGHKENPLYQNEESPLYKNEDSYYVKSKVEVETFVTNFFKHHPETILTVLRPALVFGPSVRNMFSAFYSAKITSLPLGASPHIQLIHEDDLGEAMYLCLINDLPGIYNIGANDAMSLKKSFRMAGVKIVPLPAFILKRLADIAFSLGLLPASSGWVSVSSYTIFSDNHKFKNATGWKPEYSSEETFVSYLDFHKQFQP